MRGARIGPDVGALLDEPAPVQEQRALGIDFGVDPDRLAASVLGLGIGLTVQRVLDASVAAEMFSEGVRVLLGGAVRAGVD